MLRGVAIPADALTRLLGRPRRYQRGGRVTGEGGSRLDYDATASSYTPPYNWNFGNPTGPTTDPSIEPPDIAAPTQYSAQGPDYQFDPGAYDQAFGNFDPGVPQMFPQVPYEWTSPYDYQGSLTQDVNPNFEAMSHSGDVTKPKAEGGVITDGDAEPNQDIIDRARQHQGWYRTGPQFDPAPVPMLRGIQGRRFDPRVSRRDLSMMARRGGIAAGEESHQPQRSGTRGMLAAAPDASFQDGGTAKLSPEQQRMAHEQAMSAVRPSYVLGPLKAMGRSLMNLVPNAQDIKNIAALERPETYRRTVPAFSREALDMPSHLWGMLPNTKDFEAIANLRNPEAWKRNLKVGSPEWGQQVGDTGAKLIGTGATVVGAPALAEEGIAQDLPSSGTLPRAVEAGGIPLRTPLHGAGSSYQEGGMVQPGMIDPTQINLSGAPQQQASAVAGEPAKKQQAKKAQGPQKYEFGPADYFYTAELEKIARQQAEQEAAQQVEKGQGMAGGGVIPKEFMTYMANGGLVRDVGPDHHLMFALGMAHGLSMNHARNAMA